jgi:hypothetical protein
MCNYVAAICFLERFQSEFVSPLLLSQPFSERLADDPALASFQTIRGLVQSRNKIGWKVGCNDTGRVRHRIHSD